jgi:hypothetical protein
MTCSRCGQPTCDGTCAPAPAPNKAELARRRRLERGDTLPDLEDEEDEDDLFDATDDDAAEEITQVDRRSPV